MSEQAVTRAVAGYDAAMQGERAPETALEAALERVGERWALLLVDALLEGPKRFNELLDLVPGIAPNILSQRLKHLEREAILVARPYQRRPIRLSYELTAASWTTPSRPRCGTSS
ncbi:MAG: helix-turn-helix transcriptional regulator [Actinobacteria bacterium]|nr:MAG: helix-turn-helix transcriptional regulator [Actinomycetota bacterium]